MLKDITLGQYFPGNTIVHRLDPRTKLMLTVLFIACIFTAKSYISYLAAFLSLSLYVALSRVNPALLLRGLKPLLFIMAFTSLINIFYTEGTPLLTIWRLTITVEGVRLGVFMLLRVTMLVAGTFLLTYTTSPIAITDGLESAMSPLKRFRVPVHELSMMMSIALRFIPTLIEETDKIMSAQKARGANFETGKLTDRARALLPLLVPLFVSAFRRADELAIAMECRCYNGGEGRTRMKELKYKGADAVAIAAGFALLALIIWLSSMGM